MSVEFDKKKMEAYRSDMLSSVKFKMGLFASVPMAFFAGCKVIELSEEKCVTTVPYQWMNNNPFKTTYWAVLGMAAEMAPGALLLMYTYQSKPSISTFVTACEAKFVKRALTQVTFVCEEGIQFRDAVALAVETGQAQTLVTNVKGYDTEGQVVSEWSFTWGIKARSK